LKKNVYQLVNRAPAPPHHLSRRLQHEEKAGMGLTNLWHKLCANFSFISGWQDFPDSGQIWFITNHATIKLQRNTVMICMPNERPGFLRELEIQFPGKVGISL
jgi:hypothetical protein